MPKKDRYFGRYLATEEAAALYTDQDIDSALTAFDKSRWKEKVNKILIQEEYVPPYHDPNDTGPLNRFK